MGVALALAVGTALLYHLQQSAPWLAKDVIWLLPDASCGLVESVAAWAQFYSNPAVGSAAAWEVGAHTCLVEACGSLPYSRAMAACFVWDLDVSNGPMGLMGHALSSHGWQVRNAHVNTNWMYLACLSPKATQAKWLDLRQHAVEPSTRLSGCSAHGQRRPAAWSYVGPCKVLTVC